MEVEALGMVNVHALEPVHDGQGGGLGVLSVDRAHVEDGIVIEDERPDAGAESVLDLVLEVDDAVARVQLLLQRVPLKPWRAGFRLAPEGRAQVDVGGAELRPTRGLRIGAS